MFGQQAAHKGSLHTAAAANYAGTGGVAIKPPVLQLSTAKEEPFSPQEKSSPVQGRFILAKAPAPASIPVVQRIDYSDAALNRKRRKALVGLEMTFTNAFTQQHFTNDGFQPESEKAKVDQYKNAWRQRAAADLININANQPAGANVALTVTQEAHPQGDRHIYGEFGLLKFRYTNLKISQNHIDAADQSDSSDWYDEEKVHPEMQNVMQDAGDWWWGLTLDPAAFEMLTKPTTWQVYEFSQVADVVDQTIYGGAAAQGLTAEIGKGGGQINVDFETGFDEDHNKVLDTINNAEKSDAWRDSNLREASDYNGPYIYNSTRVKAGQKGVERDVIKAEWDTIYKRFKGNLNDTEDWARFKAAYIAFLKQYPALQQTKKDYLQKLEPLFTGTETDNDKDVMHFQAVNVGHVSDKKPEKRRVEFRDLRAQQNRQEVLDAIDLTFSVIPDLEED